MCTAYNELGRAAIEEMIRDDVRAAVANVEKIMGGKSPYGVVGDVVLGILGALLGGYGLSLIGISGNGGLVATFIVALVGAIFIIWVVRKIKG